MKHLSIILLIVLGGCTWYSNAYVPEGHYWYPTQSIKVEGVPFRLDVGLVHEDCRNWISISNNYLEYWEKDEKRTGSYPVKMGLNFLADSSLKGMNLNEIIQVDSVRMSQYTGGIKVDFNSELCKDTVIVVKSYTCECFLHMMSFACPCVRFESLPDSFTVDAFLSIYPPNNSDDPFTQEYSFVLKREYMKCSWIEFRKYHRQYRERQDEVFSGCE